MTRTIGLTVIGAKVPDLTHELMVLGHVMYIIVCQNWTKNSRNMNNE